MEFNNHDKLNGLHAYLSASKFHWINYDEEKMETTYRNHLAKMRGTRLHEYAAESIRLNQKLPRTNKTLNLYVNDAIGFKMKPEQVLYYSNNCFGTADAICFRNKFLRIHDLKTGVTPAHMEQLEIYAALFCLEYNVKPKSIEMELRIYQNDQVIISNPSAEDIEYVMEKIIIFDNILNRINLEEV